MKIKILGLQFIIPTVIIFLIVLFWEKISEKIYKKFKVKINHIAILIFLMNIEIGIDMYL